MSGRTEHLLRRRAERIARPIKQAARRETRAYLSCGVGRQQVGLPIERVLGVSRLPPLTPIPGSNSALLGLAYVRGRLVAAVDLRSILGEQHQALTPRLALVTGALGAVGLVVDHAERLIEVAADDHCQHLPPEVEHPFIAAVAHDLTRLIDVDALLDSPLLRATVIGPAPLDTTKEVVLGDVP